MNSRPLRLLVLLLVCLSALPAARADIELSGVLVAGEKTTLGLADTATEEVRWLALGQSFAGWKLAAYDTKKETLTLTNGDTTKLVKLKTAVIQESKPFALAGDIEIKLNGKTITLLPLTLVADQTSTIQLGEGITGKFTLSVLPDGNVLYETSFEGVLGSDGKRDAMHPSVIASPNFPASVTMREIDGPEVSFSFTPKGSKLPEKPPPDPDDPFANPASAPPASRN